MIVDAFPFFNELDLLEIRLHEIGDLVDVFVVGEATTTFSGHQKPMYLSDNLDRFEAYREKIFICRIDETPAGTPFEAEWFQRNYLRDAILSLASPTDILIFSDVDEIPRREVIENLLATEGEWDFVHLAQDMSYYYVNLRKVGGKLLSVTGEFPGVREPKWLGTKVLKVSQLLNGEGLTLDDLRKRDRVPGSVRMDNGGWHFSFCGSPDDADAAERAQAKIDAYAHQELNNWRTRLTLKRRISRGRDVFFRRGAKFSRVPLDDTFPHLIREQPERFRHLVLDAE